MPDPAPNPDLLRSLAKLVRGLSALFWGLPITLIVCVWTSYTQWIKSAGWIPPLVATAMLMYGLWQLSGFQKQERIWRKALDFSFILALINFGLSPFLFFWTRIPGNVFFTIAVVLLVVFALLFLGSLNLVLQRLGAMLPDESLRLETKQFTAINLNLLLLIFLLAGFYFILHRFPAFTENLLNSLPPWLAKLVMVLDNISPFLLLLLVLLPLAMTMALLWKTKEIILDSVFGIER
jgi:hypothetical protein